MFTSVPSPRFSRADLEIKIFSTNKYFIMEYEISAYEYTFVLS